MKKILLVCAAGMSTSLLVKKMREAAKNKNVDVEIKALPSSEAHSVIKEVDVILLGPQVRYQKPQIEKEADGRIPVDVIDMQAYGVMNGEAVLNQALKLLGE